MSGSGFFEGAFRSPVFVLGTERSGSTWLANILDAAPSTVLFMEPFCVPVGLFADFPEPSFFLPEASSAMTQFLRHKMPSRLLRYKTFVLDSSISDPRMFKVDRALAAMARHSHLRRVRNRARGFELLNLNRLDARARRYPKQASIEHVVVKELRLAGKIPLLRSAFPSARFVVLIRHPCATVNSILRWFERGRLQELRNTMDTYLDKIDAQSIGSAYRGEIEICRRGSLAHLLGLYWRISYETICKELRGHDQLIAIAYEELASNPMDVTKQLLAQLEIPWGASVEDYIEYSSGNDVANPSAVTTVRHSRTYYRQWQSEISTATREAVAETTEESALMSIFDDYYS